MGLYALDLFSTWQLKINVWSGHKTQVPVGYNSSLTLLGKYEFVIATQIRMMMCTIFVFIGVFLIW